LFILKDTIVNWGNKAFTMRVAYKSFINFKKKATYISKNKNKSNN